MLMLNTMDGMPRKTVRARIAVEVDMAVGGTDDADRLDSVRELFNDHAGEIEDTLSGHPWFKDGVVSVDLAGMKVMEDNGDE